MTNLVSLIFCSTHVQNLLEGRSAVGEHGVPGGDDRQAGLLVGLMAPQCSSAQLYKLVFVVVIVVKVFHEHLQSGKRTRCRRAAARLAAALTLVLHR